MGDAYGTITITNNSKADPEKLLVILNRYIWNADCELVQRKNDHFYIDGTVQYPSIFPNQKILSDGDYQTITETDSRYDEPLKPDWTIEAGDDVDIEDVIKSIGAILREGDLRIISMTTHSDSSISTHDLLIRADQTGTVTTILSDVRTGVSHQVHEYS